MTAYVIRRAGWAIVTLLLASVVVFLGAHALPGDPALALAGQEGARDPELLAAIRERYGLDQPLPAQYVAWLSQVLQGDFGQSIRTSLPVADMVADRIPVTLQLAACSLLVAMLVGIPIGVLAAMYRGRWPDHLGNALTLTGMSVPNFWVGLILIAVFAVQLGIFPASGFVAFADDPVANLQHLVLPSVVLGMGLSAVIMRQTRSSMVQTLSADFIRTARAKGLSEWSVVVRHALRNSLLTVTTILGLQLGLLIAGSVVTEQIFLIPGFGKLIIDAVSTRDYPVIQAVTLLAAVAYIVVNLLVDVLYTVLNPRVRLEAKAA
ncbi:ABC transporter permease [Jiangella mangrovi]|uniref:Peptide/nickel transport system permease protein n=1 Tax=Jiangella mangrovi TaxID=1524084 RepID=A0A7W9GL75_9ACTN|nr:ABC transporter permease [Jiangella mangrovi]MBB5785707.1 peptide/nickel transport system permease protein [Jiangella mangrovi]